MPNKVDRKRWHLGMARMLHGRMGPWRHELLPAWGALGLGTREMWRAVGSERLWRAGVHPRPARRAKKVGKQNQPELDHAYAWLPRIIGLPH